MRRFSLLLLVLTVAAAMVITGCKKKPVEKKAAAKKTHKVEKKTAETEADKPAPEALQDEPAGVEPAGDVVEPAEGDKPVESDQPVEGDKPAEGDQPVEGDKPAEGDQPVEGDKPAESDQPVEGDVVEETDPAGTDVVEQPVGDVVAEAGDVAAEVTPAGHFGPAFKLNAIMMLSDVIKYPKHYSEFESIKLKGVVLGVAGDLVLLGHETVDGFYFMASDLSKAKGDIELKVGHELYLEGKLVESAWKMEPFGAIATGDKEIGVDEAWTLEIISGQIN